MTYAQYETATRDVKADIDLRFTVSVVTDDDGKALGSLTRCANGTSYFTVFYRRIHEGDKRNVDLIRFYDRSGRFLYEQVYSESQKDIDDGTKFEEEMIRFFERRTRPMKNRYGNPYKRGTVLYERWRRLHGAESRLLLRKRNDH